MHEGVLPHVERREMELEGRQPAPQAVDVEEPGAPAFVGEQALAQELEVAGQLLVAVVSRVRLLPCGGQPSGDELQEDAVRHAAPPRRDRLDGARKP